MRKVIRKTVPECRDFICDLAKQHGMKSANRTEFRHVVLDFMSRGIQDDRMFAARNSGVIVCVSNTAEGVFCVSVCGKHIDEDSVAWRGIVVIAEDECPLPSESLIFN